MKSNCERKSEKVSFSAFRGLPNLRGFNFNLGCAGNVNGRVPPVAYAPGSPNHQGTRSLSFIN